MTSSLSFRTSYPQSKAAYVLFYIRQDCLKDFSQNGLATLAKLEDMDDETSKNSESEDEEMETNWCCLQLPLPEGQITRCD